jgi:hypothetical protein
LGLPGLLVRLRLRRLRAELLALRLPLLERLALEFLELDRSFYSLPCI